MQSQVKLITRTGGWSSAPAGQQMVQEIYQDTVMDLLMQYLMNGVSGAAVALDDLAAVRRAVQQMPGITADTAGVPLAAAAVDQQAGKSVAELAPGLPVIVAQLLHETPHIKVLHHDVEVAYLQWREVAVDSLPNSR